MQTEDRRCEPRHNVDQVRTEFTVAGSQYEGVMVDVSKHCARINLTDGLPCCGGDDTGSISVWPHYAEWQPFPCSIRRVHEGRPAICVVAFEHELSDSQIVELVRQKEPSSRHYRFEQARTDESTVRQELLRIQTCRSRVFIATMAALAAGSMTAAVAASNTLSTLPVSTWGLFGATTAGFLLLVGMLATVEKARVINLRRGFLAALSEYLEKGEAPPSYRGWSYLRSAQADCGVRWQSGTCTQTRRFRNEKSSYRKSKEEHESGSANTPFPGEPPWIPETCWSLGKVEAEPRYASRKLLPGMFDSFMSFSGAVYGLAYCIVCIILTVSLSFVLQRRTGVNLLTSMAISAAGVALGAGVMYCTSRRWERARGKRRSGGLSRTEPAWKFVRGALAVAAFLTLALVTASLSVSTPSHQGKAIAVATTLCLGGTVGVLAVFLVDQLQKIRRGLYSVESLHAAWRRVLLDCHGALPMRRREDLSREARNGPNGSSAPQAM